MNIQKVQPGDEIKASEWNKLVDVANNFSSPIASPHQIPNSQRDTQRIAVYNDGNTVIDKFSLCYSLGYFANCDSQKKQKEGVYFELEKKAQRGDLPICISSDCTENNSDLIFIAEESIPPNKTGIAIPACGPIFFTRLKIYSSLPYKSKRLFAWGAGDHFNTSDSFTGSYGIGCGYRVVATTDRNGNASDYSLGALGYFQNKYSIISKEEVAVLSDLSISKTKKKIWFVSSVSILAPEDEQYGAYTEHSDALGNIVEYFNEEEGEDVKYFCQNFLVTRPTGNLIDLGNPASYFQIGIVSNRDPNIPFHIYIKWGNEEPDIAEGEHISYWSNEISIGNYPELEEVTYKMVQVLHPIELIDSLTLNSSYAPYEFPVDVKNEYR